MATDPAVQAWITKHSSDIYETDLWFVVKEGGKEIRVPACRAVLKLTCALVRDLEAERAPFERHSKRMFRYFLEFNKQKWSALVKDRLGTLPIMDPIFSAMNDMHRAMEYLTNPA